jgi:hypothetical protein
MMMRTPQRKKVFLSILLHEKRYTNYIYYISTDKANKYFLCN